MRTRTPRRNGDPADEPDLAGRASLADRAGRPIRFLVTSDAEEPALLHARNREALGEIDAVIGCGDLDPDWLCFLADAFQAPLVYVRGNHDRDGSWAERPQTIPSWLRSDRVERMAGLPVIGLEWPGMDQPGNRRHPWRAWQQALALARRLITGRLWRSPLVVISHVPPAGVGDAPGAYHRGFNAYRWLLDVFTPPVWLHGHTTTASVTSLVEQHGPTVVANVTGAVLLEITPAAGA